MTATKAKAPGTSTREAVLRAVGVRVRFGGIEALAGVDCSVAEHEILAIIGPNGAGKSTLFNVLSGLTAPSAGRVGGAVAAAPSESLRAAVGRLAIGCALALCGLLVCGGPEHLWAHGVLEPHRARLLAERRGEAPEWLEKLGPSAWRALGNEPVVLAERRGWRCVQPHNSTSFARLAQAAAVCAPAKDAFAPRARARRARCAGLGALLGIFGWAAARRHARRTHPRARAHAGLARTFQNIRLFWGLSAFDNVRVVVEHAPWARTLGRAAINEHTAHLLARLGLNAHRDTLAEALSYGDQRRLEIARALALRPRVVLLDEPAAGMHAGETAQLLQLVHALRAEGMAVVLIEHDMKLVLGVSDRVLVLDHGAPIACAPPADIVHDPAVIAAYLGQAPPLASAL